MDSEPDVSHELDMVTLFSSSNHDAEMECTAIRSLLDANGIQALVVGASTLPVLEFEVQVPRENLADAERIIAEAKAAGPSAAAEAEQAGEEGR